MLDRLIDYARRQGLETEPGFQVKNVCWGVTIARNGTYLAVLALGDASDKRNKGFSWRCPHLSLPELKRGGAGCRHFLVDNTEVAALYSGTEDESADPKVLAKHRYFVDLFRQAAENLPELEAIATCLESPEQLKALRRALAQSKAKTTENLTFRIGRESPYLVQGDTWHSWWRAFRASLTQSSGAETQMRCLLTGELVEPVLTHPKITGLVDVGGLSMGSAVASYKQPAFRSYGLVQSANAAVSEAAAAQYVGALNHILAHHSERLAGVRVAHWYKEPPEEDPLASLPAGETPEQQTRRRARRRPERDAQKRARDMLGGMRTGDRPNLGRNRYYALTLSGASARVMVRDWMEGAFEELVLAIDTWFDDLDIVRRDGLGLAPSPKFYAVLGATVRELDDLASPLVARLWRVAVRGETIPEVFAAQTLQRVRCDMVQNETPRYARYGLLKAYLIRKGDRHMQAELNENHPSPAYHCGRVMAVLAAAQYRALGDVGAGVVQRYYAAASSTPALVLGRLVRNSQFHLAKLKKGARLYFEKKIGMVMTKIGDEPPKTLSLEEQTLFALGYYQQMAADRPRKNKDNPGAGEPSPGDLAETETN